MNCEPSPERLSGCFEKELIGIREPGVCAASLFAHSPAPSVDHDPSCLDHRDRGSTNIRFGKFLSISGSVYRSFQQWVKLETVRVNRKDIGDTFRDHAQASYVSI